MTTRWTTADIARELQLSSREAARYAVYRWIGKGLIHDGDIEIDRKTGERLYLPWQVWSARALDRKGERTDLLSNGQPETATLHAVAETDDTDNQGMAHIRILENPNDWYSEIDTVVYPSMIIDVEAIILRALTTSGYRVMGAPVHRTVRISVPVTKNNKR